VARGAGDPPYAVHDTVCRGIALEGKDKNDSAGWPPSSSNSSWAGPPIRQRGNRSP